ncbi:MAG: STAS-like domain-containing protein [Bacteroidales bacterium]|nr:STAS-like domain-containing protein [Bacteroidales bacterium]
MISITVFPIMRDNNYPTAGEVLYGIIMKDIDSADKIILDMKGISLIPSMFLNTSLGRIINERGVDFVKSKLGFSNIKSSDATRIREYVGRFQ